MEAGNKQLPQFTQVATDENVRDHTLKIDLLPNAPHIWAKYSSPLNRIVAKQNTDPRRWSNEEVIQFVQSVPLCKKIANTFRQHAIDGEAFLMLTQDDLVSSLGLRLGPAIKLYNCIVLLRAKTM